MPTNLDAHMISDNGIKSIVWRWTRFERGKRMKYMMRNADIQIAKCCHQLSGTFPNEISRNVCGICEQIHFRRMTWLKIIAMADILPNGIEFFLKMNMVHDIWKCNIHSLSTVVTSAAGLFAHFRHEIQAILRLFDNNTFEKMNKTGVI